MTELADSYDNCHARPRNQTRSILSRLDRLEIPEDIKAEADSIFLQIGSKTNKNNQLKQKEFFCVYTAYRRKGIPTSSKILAAKIGLPAKNISHAISMFSELNTGFSTEIIKISPIDLIPEYCEFIGIGQDLKDPILKIARRVMNPYLLERDPEVVAPAIILYSAELFGFKLDLELFTSKVFYSLATMNGIVKIIRQNDI